MGCPGLLLYIYDQPTVTVFGHPLSARIYFALYDTATFLGGAVGRFMSYKTEKRRHPLVFNVLTIVGVSMVLANSPELALFAGFVILAADGSIYGRHRLRGRLQPAPLLAQLDRCRSGVRETLWNKGVCGRPFSAVF